MHTYVTSPWPIHLLTDILADSLVCWMLIIQNCVPRCLVGDRNSIHIEVKSKEELDPICRWSGPGRLQGPAPHCLEMCWEPGRTEFMVHRLGLGRRGEDPHFFFSEKPLNHFIRSKLSPKFIKINAHKEARGLDNGSVKRRNREWCREYWLVYCSVINTEPEEPMAMNIHFWLESLWIAWRGSALVLIGWDDSVGWLVPFCSPSLILPLWWAG